MSALAKITAIVMVEQLPKGWNYFEEKEPIRIKKAELFPCFYNNNGLKVVRPPVDPDDVYCHVRPYTVVHHSGFTIPFIESYQLEKVIAYCDLLAQIPEFCFPICDREAAKPKAIAIAEQIDQDYPEIEFVPECDEDEED